MTITTDYVDARFQQFVAKYQAVLKELNYEPAYIEQSSRHLAQRLATRDFKRYGDRPIQLLHAGKRVTRALIKFAIHSCPAQKRRRELLQQQYNDRLAMLRERNPEVTVFSFEATYAAKLKIDLRPYKAFFYLTY